MGGLQLQNCCVISNTFFVKLKSEINGETSLAPLYLKLTTKNNTEALKQRQPSFHSIVMCLHFKMDIKIHDRS